MYALLLVPLANSNRGCLRQILVPGEDSVWTVQSEAPGAPKTVSLSLLDV